MARPPTNLSQLSFGDFAGSFPFFEKAMSRHESREARPDQHSPMAKVFQSIWYP